MSSFRAPCDGMQIQTVILDPEVIRVQWPPIKMDFHLSIQHIYHSCNPNENGVPFVHNLDLQTSFELSQIML